MESNNKIEVVKVPNSKDNKVSNTNPNFERYPRQYLELLENKDKVKTEMVNKDYDPDDAISLREFERNASVPTKNKVKQNFGNINEEEDEDLLSISDVEDGNKDGNIESENEISDDDGGDDDDDDDDDDDEEEEEEEFDLDDDDDDIEGKSEGDYGDDESLSGGGNQTKEKLKQMFHPEGPKLSDLQRDGVINNTNRTIPNINMMDDTDDDDEDKKRELIFKFNLLRRSYKNVDIPEFTIHSNYKKMNDSYEQTLRMLSLDSSVEQFKQILIGGFMLTEYLMGYLKFDMEGFTKHQILQLGSYERLLLELGQKNYTPTDQQLPVEIRLIGMIIMNAVIFIISKLILKKTGTNLMSMLNHNVRDKYTQNVESNYTNNINEMKNPYEFTSSVSNASEGQKHHTEQRKMKRPSFDFASL